VAFARGATTPKRTNHYHRRDVLRAIGAAALAVGLAGCGGDGGDGSDGGGPEYLDEEPDYGDWFDDVSNYEGRTLDLTGESEVAVGVGAGEEGLLFDPPAIAVDPGTTVVWEWTGQGGQHNVAAEDADFESETTGEEGFTFEYDFEDGGVHRYVCRPHRAVGMKGAVTVQD